MFALIRPARRLLPDQMRQSMSILDDDLRRAGLQQFRYWVIVHAALLVTFLLRVGWEALVL